jgi:hypothetical protein
MQRVVAQSLEYAIQMTSENTEARDSRRLALIGLLIVALLTAGGLFLAHKLRTMSKLQDCVMQGRSNCAPID